MLGVTEKPHQRLASKFKELLATYRQAEDLINIGAYKAGSNPKIDYAISKMDAMNAYIRQDILDGISVRDAIGGLLAILGNESLQ
jgi:flagellum-specific ATP synthase